MARTRSRHSPGPSQRQLRVGELIRRRLSEVLQRSEVHDPDLNRHSITVGEVRMSPDLKVATAYVLPLGGRDVETALEDLRRNTAELRHFVADGLNLKYAPALRFVPDETFDRLDDVRRMFADARVRRDVEADEGADGGAGDEADDGADTPTGPGGASGGPGDGDTGEGGRGA